MGGVSKTRAEKEGKSKTKNACKWSGSSRGKRQHHETLVEAAPRTKSGGRRSVAQRPTALLLLSLGPADVEA